MSCHIDDHLLGSTKRRRLFVGDFHLNIFTQKKLQFSPQIANSFASSPMNSQHLDYGPPNYQKASKMSILSKYAYNTSVTCYFSIKKKTKKKLKFKN
jgi:hypothetical protein